MRILILNVGSSSVKYEVFDKERSIVKGKIERIRDKKGFSSALKKIAGILRAIKSTSRVSRSLIKRIEKVNDLAPLHNIPEVSAIKLCLKLFRKPQFAVFDTAFHQTMPEKAFTYALPYGLADRFGIRKYGFHGTSHEYVAHEACRKLRKDIRRSRIITCHLGNGCSITAIKNRKSIDTSMGFTPLEGLVMGTRCGDIHPAITILLQKKGYSANQIDKMLNHKSGLLIGRISFLLKEDGDCRVNV